MTRLKINVLLHTPLVLAISYVRVGGGGVVEWGGEGCGGGQDCQSPVSGSAHEYCNKDNSGQVYTICQNVSHWSMFLMIYKIKRVLMLSDTCRAL